MHIGNYHAEMMGRASASIELVPAASRDLSSLTFCLPADGIARLKQRIAEFRRELIELAEAQTERTPGRAAQLPTLSADPAGRRKPRAEPEQGA